MRPRAEVAIACCRASPAAAADDLYPDPDSELLRDHLGRIGLAAVLISWDDPDADWGRWSAVVVRSTWDSVDRPGEYLAWARQAAAVSVLINQAPVIEWNLDKRYLTDLAGAGMPVVPTRWVRPGDTWDPPDGEYVVKPSISAGGRDTARYGPGHGAEGRAHMARLLADGRTVMVQEHLAAVESPGELSLIFVDSRFSHAVRKGPLLELGAGVLSRPWERSTSLGLAGPSAAQLTVAEATLNAVHGRFPDRLAYARIDLVDGPSGDPLVLEVELIDPVLSLTLAPTASERLAAVVAEQAGSVR